MLKIKLEKGGILPHKAYEGDAGFDLYVPIDSEPIIFTFGTILRLDLKIKIEGERGYYYRVDDKSGLASKGLSVRGGIVDNNYIGNIHVVCQYFGEDSLRLDPGSKIAQLLVCPVYDGIEIEEITTIKRTNRGDNGFGSTGK